MFINHFKKFYGDFPKVLQLGSSSEAQLPLRESLSLLGVITVNIKE